MTADLLAALRPLVEYPIGEDVGGCCTVCFMLVAHEPYDCEMGQVRAAIAAHKEAHRGGTDDACPCYAEGWRAGYEAERKPPGYC